MVNNKTQEETLENAAPEVTGEKKVEETISTEETWTTDPKAEETSQENSPEESKNEEETTEAEGTSENVEDTEKKAEETAENNDENKKDEETQAEEENSSETIKNEDKNEEETEETNSKKDKKVVSIRTKLLCNCKYWRIWHVVEMSEDVFNAFGKWYVEKTTEKLTNKNRSVIIEKSKAEREAEEKERISKRKEAMEERKKNFWTISKAWEK